MLNFVKIDQTVADISRFMAQCVSLCQLFLKSVQRLQRYRDLTFFKDGGRPPAWIRCWRIWTTHSEHVVVSIIVQDLVAIDAAVLIIGHFQYYAR